MTASESKGRFVLVLEDVRETATLIRSLLTRSGFSVALAADEQDAIERIRTNPTDVLLISLGLEAEQLIVVAERIRKNAGMVGGLPIVIFCVPTIPEGAELEVRANTYLVRPDDFNQLRAMLRRLLATSSGG